MDKVSKFNPHHDEFGRFTFARSASDGGSVKPIRRPAKLKRKKKKKSAKKEKTQQQKPAPEYWRIFRSPLDLRPASEAARTARFEEEKLTKANPYHDSLGRFTTASAANATASFLRPFKLAVIGGLGRKKPAKQRVWTESSRKWARGISAGRRRKQELIAAREKAKQVAKANPYKDEMGRFTSADKAVGPKGGRKNSPSRLQSTMQKKGGFTYDSRKDILKRSGFAVSVDKSAEQVTSESNFAKNGIEMVKRFLADQKERLGIAGQYLGGWVERGKVYLDISTVVKTAEEAANLARKHDQIAFFDLKTFTTWTRFQTTSGIKYLASGIQTSGQKPLVGEVPVGGIDVARVGKAEAVEGVILCAVESLLDDQSIQNFVEQILATSKVSKGEPTVSDVHVPTIMYNKKRKKKIKKSEIVAKKARLKDPKGGLTAAGRRHFNRTTGSNLRPGVKGKADTPEKMRRKGSFLTRFFTNPSGPMKDDKGRPTRLALSAAAWGEPVPKDRASAARLAEKGRNLLERYENQKKKVEKANPYHDERGRFTSANNATGGRSRSTSARGMGASAARRAASRPSGETDLGPNRNIGEVVSSRRTRNKKMPKARAKRSIYNPKNIDDMPDSPLKIKRLRLRAVKALNNADHLERLIDSGQIPKEQVAQFRKEISASRAKGVAATEEMKAVYRRLKAKHKGS